MAFSAPIRLRFGEFEADLHTAELFRNGGRVPLQEKPFLILAMLLMRPGEMVSRAHIFEEVWSDTYVQGDQSLNTAMRKVRLALGDSPECPRYIGTVGSRGYRFLESVHLVQPESGPTPAGLRIGLMPFNEIGPGPDGTFGEHLTEGLLARLSRVHPLLRVSAPPEHSNGQFAEELDLDYLLAGTIRWDGAKVRVTVKLLETEDQRCFFSETYERDIAEAFAIQQDIGDKLARRALRLLSPTGSVQGTNVSAVEAYLRGRFFWNKRTAPALLKSLEFFNEALNQDPGYMMAYVGLADSYIMLAQHGIRAPLEVFPKAREAAAKALELDDTIAEAYAPLALAKTALDRDLFGAELKCRKALELDPSYAFTYVAYGFVLTIQGRHSETMAALKRALHLDPVSLPINSIYASALLFARQYDAAIEQCRACMELDPNFTLPYAVYGQALEQKGELVEATEYFTTQMRLAPLNPLAWAHLARVYARRGLRAESLQFLNRLLDLANEKYVPSYFIALIYEAVGDSEKMFEWLNKDERERSNWIMFAGVDPRLDKYRDDPRFEELLRKLKLRGLVQSASA